MVITGPPGAGKTTVSRLVARSFDPVACVIESDWWWTTIVKGHIDAWQPEAHAQNRAVVRSFAAAAAVMASEGFATVLEGIVGPWMLDLVVAEADEANVQLHYVVLRPTLEVALERARSRQGDERVPGHPALTASGPVRQLWEQFSDLGTFEPHALDNTSLGPETTAERVSALVADAAMTVSSRAS